MKSLIHFCLHQKLVLLLLLAFFIGWGIRVAPFDWDTGNYPRDPVAVDAIPDLGDNQQIVFTEWPGRSPQDIEDQVTYPLTVALLGVPGVREVRSYSMFGSSSIYLIFEENVEFYWSRSRVLEKLNSLPSNLLPEDVTPTLGPDATGLGQVFWYTLEGRDPDGQPAGGWDLDELRAIQDWQVRYSLLSAKGVAEVSSIGGFERQYQVDVDPDALRAHDVTLAQVVDAVRKSNQEIGARNLAVNGVEYFLRGTGYIHSVDDLSKAVVTVRGNTPITVDDVAHVTLGPAQRRGALDVNGADAVGGVVVARFGANPLEAIKATRARIDALRSSLPIRAFIDWSKTTPAEVAQFARQHQLPSFADEPQAWLDFTRETTRSAWPTWLTTSQITVVPFYDRSHLIGETLHTLDEALYQQVLVTIIVVIVMVLHLRSSLLISAMLPLAVLITFIAMKVAGVDANVVALSGIAIAIGTVVDVGIVLTENILKHLDEADPSESRAQVIHRAVTEVAGAVTTSVLTTVISFLPVFAMTGEAGRLFRPLAFTKSFALMASIVVALTLIPPLAHLLFGTLPQAFRARRLLSIVLLVAAAALSWVLTPWLTLILLGVAAGVALEPYVRGKLRRRLLLSFNLIGGLVVVGFLTLDWMPLGLDRSTFQNGIFVVLIVGGLLLGFKLFELTYPRVLRACLDHKGLFLTLPVTCFLLALCFWLGFPKTFAFLPKITSSHLTESRLWKSAAEKFPGLGREFRPALDEGSFLFMPTISPHASMDEALGTLRQLDQAIAGIPEVDRIVGKIGRADSPLDPAPISMIEAVVHYVPEYRSDDQGRVLRYRTDRQGNFLYDTEGQLTEDPRGRPFRQWRPDIHSPDDIWREIEHVTQLPGVTGAPKLQPIETRLVMLRTGMRAPMGIKIKGEHLEEIEQVGLQIEKLLRKGEVAGLATETVTADRIVGKPYLEILPNRDAASRYGLNISDLHETIQTAIGGRVVTRTVEGRERFAVQVRYAREERDSPEALGRVLVTTREGAQVPLSQLATIRSVPGPQMIKSEDTYKTGYVTFGALPGYAEVDVVDAARAYLESMRHQGDLKLPSGVRYDFAGNYEAALEFNRTLWTMIPLALGAIFLLLYLDNRSVTTTLIVFSGVAVAWSGGFILLGLYGQPGFLDFELFGHHFRQLFQIAPIHLSTAVWVGFLALFGIATDDGVVMSTYLRQRFDELRPNTVAAIRTAVVESGCRRVRPCLMTTATTLLALLPVLTSTGRGSDLMAPMAVPIFGGMLIELMTMFVVPVLYSWKEEARSSRARHAPTP
ncbi:Cu(I)/Ag(I) efflux system membrane protein CusA/SilA [Haloferula luteola]|uniref:Cu(I)/Ag(I) efflux system membrane protein CusA/SilA n=1 Tax=Haloferula luteola TaxID=595692 RepID=A0A840V9M4_9BACT|nr:efflux RND transporter permease subunit [Haloferula luteola]MBB5353776.1 Cu(I)/Ag(I) efflux system membrane protein CusA/SilA [Haloferula luteola]